MAAKYAYSLNGENYQGAFASREAARAAALARASGMIDPPVSVFVAEVLSGDTQASGHAVAVIVEMRRRAREMEGVDAPRYPATLSAQQMQELDADLARTINTFLEGHGLTQATFKVGGISEHPVPLPHRGLNGGMNGEVQEMGVGEYPIEVALDVR